MPVFPKQTFFFCIYLCITYVPFTFTAPKNKYVSVLKTNTALKKEDEQNALGFSWAVVTGLSLAAVDWRCLYPLTVRLAGTPNTVVSGRVELGKGSGASSSIGSFYSKCVFAQHCWQPVIILAALEAELQLWEKPPLALLSLSMHYLWGTAIRTPLCHSAGYGIPTSPALNLACCLNEHFFPFASDKTSPSNFIDSDIFLESEK